MPEPSQSSAPAWTAQLPDNLKTDQAFTGFQTIGDLAGDYLKVKGEHGELSGKMTNALFLPGKDATDEQREEFYSKLGRPKTPEEYTFKKPDNLPEGMPYDDAGEKKFRQFLHQKGVPNDVAVDLYNLYHEDAIGAWDKIQTLRKEKHNEGVKALETEWGANYKANAEKAMRVAALGGEQFSEMLDQSGLGDHPVIVRFLYGLFDLIGEDSIGSPGPRVKGGSQDSADILYPEMAAKVKNQQ